MASLVILGLKCKTEAPLGHRIYLARVCRMLARHGWCQVCNQFPKQQRWAGAVSGRGTFWPHQRFGLKAPTSVFLTASTPWKSNSCKRSKCLRKTPVHP